MAIVGNHVSTIVARPIKRGILAIAIDTGLPGSATGAGRNALTLVVALCSLLARATHSSTAIGTTFLPGTLRRAGRASPGFACPSHLATQGSIHLWTVQATRCRKA